ncbi:MAG: hypothetical protein MI976_31420 [Pseudomonadales bacterium]|nr:hypothetical protein [Pseudomonadales bacterium]
MTISLAESKVKQATLARVQPKQSTPDQQLHAMPNTLGKTLQRRIWQ